MPIEDFRRQIEVNLTGQVAVTQAFLPAIREARGRIVFISSIGGLIAFPMTGAYHAAKFGIEAVGDIFRQRAARPGASRSRSSSRARSTRRSGIGRTGHADDIGERSPHRASSTGARSSKYREVVEADRRAGIPPEKVAKAIEHALSARRPRTRYLVGLDAKAQARLRHVIPTRVLDRVVARVMGR